MGSNAGGGVTNQAPEKKPLSCGECGTYTELKKKSAAPEYERDHIPSKAALREAAFNRADERGMGPFDKEEKECIARRVEAQGITVAIPWRAHRKHSPTCGSKNKKLINGDAKDPESLCAAIKRDLADMQAYLKAANDPDRACAEEYAKAAEKIRKHPNEEMIDEALKKCAKS